MELEDLLGRLTGVTGVGPQRSAKCPAHDDQKASLSVSQGKDGRILVNCHATCTVEAIVAAVGLKVSDLMPPNGGHGREPVTAATYNYRDERGTVLYQSVRYVPKDFRQRHLNAAGEWVWNLRGVRRVLYRLPELLAADPEEIVFVVEGEKDVDRLREMELVSTCNAMGAGKWIPEYSGHLRGRVVVVIPDNDTPGRDHARAVVSSLGGIAKSVRVLELEDLPKSGDVSDWLAAGHTDGELLKLAVLQEREPPAAAGISDWIRPGEGLAARPVPMARVSLATVLPELHRMTRKGFPTGGTVGILGGPDTGKTGVAMTIADAAEREGFVVVHMTDDNGREAAEIRWGQMMGFDRTKLEEGDPTEIARFQAAFATRNIYMPDPDEVDVELRPINTLAHVIEETKRRFPERKVALLVDSTQAVVPDRESYESPRLRVIETMKLLRKAASMGWVVVATSQTSRDSRKHKNEAKNTSPMTSGAESGSIEYGFDFLFSLSVRKEDGGGMLRAEVLKNKPGAGIKGEFPILWDRNTARASEPDAATFADEARTIAKQADEGLCTRILEILAKNPGLTTSKVTELARRRDVDCTRALWSMKDDDDPPRVRMVSEGKARYWYVGGQVPEQREIT